MPDIKRTRKGRPGPKAQRSALIVAKGKKSGRDATNTPKREAAPKAPRAPILSVFEAGDSVEAFLERAQEEEAFATAHGDAPAPARPAARAAPAVAPGALFAPLSVPRRPPWDASTSAADLAAAELATFTDWRREVAALEEAERAARAARAGALGLAPSASVATPFERNLDVWRQLWRTLERSDCVLLLVDARWPDLYAPPDLLASRLRRFIASPPPRHGTGTRASSGARCASS